MNEDLLNAIQDLTESNRNLNGQLVVLEKSNEELIQKMLWLNAAINNLSDELKKARFS